ncbi:C-type lectin domain family 2 member L-like [Ornithorhynchus anatinus]|uniref:C-type lectin domain-containing protein n=1 Tax=Ornithorhynchus anatinus TaxID=9258 RepID=F6Y3P5_ORNAN|nr:C-type lectin domain family 2 member L-like [Ornithorhynchus anatinus]
MAEQGGHQEEGKVLSNQFSRQEQRTGEKRQWRDGTVELKWYTILIPSTAGIILIVVLIALASKTCPKCDETCPDGWLQLRNKCYSYNNGNINWPKSKEVCKSQGANLVVIESHQELSFVQKFKGHWIGLFRENGKLFWVNGVPLNESLFPVTDPGNCAYISTNKIATNGCNESKPFVCSMSLTVT